MNRPPRSLLSTFSLAVLLAALPVAAQDAEDEEAAYGWSDAAELSYVVTGGNAEAATLSLRNSLVRTWEGRTFTLEAGALRAETTALSRSALGSEDSFRIRESSQTAVSAENYFLRARFEKALSERMFWFTGAGWERNEPAGIENRLNAVAGVGHTWFDRENSHFHTDYGLTYTRQEDVFEDPAKSDSFLGLRLGWDYRRGLGSATTFGHLSAVDVNADETSDYRLDMTNSIAVTMTDRLALKLSLQLLYDNQPSFTAVPLLAPDGAATGTTVLVPVDDLDTLFTTALVVSF